MSEKRRLLKFHILRYNPHIPGDEPRMQTFEVEEAPSMTVFIALNQLRETQDPSLQFDFVCRAGICGSCGMVINGRPDLACRTLTSKFENGEVTLLPLPAFELIGDLSVNTGKMMREMSERIEGWIHSKDAQQGRSLDVLEERMEPEVAKKIYELDRCIECGCCVSACGTKRMRENFLGAAGFMRVARFQADPRDERTDEDWYDIIGDDDGVFGCMTLLGCEDYCPKDLPHQTKIAFLRRKLVQIRRA
jgi:fumarate reductase iron-sulfur subunit